MRMDEGSKGREERREERRTEREEERKSTSLCPLSHHHPWIVSSFFFSSCCSSLSLSIESHVRLFALIPPRNLKKHYRRLAMRCFLGKRVYFVCPVHSPPRDRQGGRKGSLHTPSIIPTKETCAPCSLLAFAPHNQQHKKTQTPVPAAP